MEDEKLMNEKAAEISLQYMKLLLDYCDAFNVLDRVRMYLICSTVEEC